MSSLSCSKEPIIDLDARNGRCAAGLPEAISSLVEVPTSFGECEARAPNVDLITLAAPVTPPRWVRVAAHACRSFGSSRLRPAGRPSNALARVQTGDSGSGAGRNGSRSCRRAYWGKAHSHPTSGPGMVLGSGAVDWIFAPGAGLRPRLG